MILGLHPSLPPFPGCPGGAGSSHKSWGYTEPSWGHFGKAHQEQLAPLFSLFHSSPKQQRSNPHNLLQKEKSPRICPAPPAPAQAPQLSQGLCRECSPGIWLLSHISWLMRDSSAPLGTPRLRGGTNPSNHPDPSAESGTTQDNLG